MIELDKDLLMEAITEGVRIAFENMFAQLSMANVISDGVQDGTYRAMDQVYASQILEAIALGTERALDP